MKAILILILAIFWESQAFAHSVLKGKILDSKTQNPIENVQVLLKEKNLAHTSNAQGEFFFSNLKLKSYSLEFFRIGYTKEELKVNLKHETKEIEVFLNPTEIKANEVLILGESEKVSVNTSLEVSGRELRKNLGVTIAETMQSEPGIEMRSMGPAPSRPVLRGLSGDRLLILEDGQKTGDLSATSADHAVAIEPINAQKIEVIRGAKSILFSSNTLGGVVNVVNENIPTERIENFHGTSGLQTESVNFGLAGNISLHIPLKGLSVKFDGSLRNADDVSTPSGKLQNTQIETMNSNLGISWFKPKSFFGIAGSFYNSDYGIPGGFIGAHPNGVKIEVKRKHFEAENRFEVFGDKKLEFQYSFSDYKHKEFEGNGLVGVDFSVFTYNLLGKIHFEQSGIFEKGTLGFWSELRDYASGGFTYTPETIEKSVAMFYYQKAKLGKVDIGGSLRFDFRNITPSKNDQGIVQNVGEIRSKNFGGSSGILESSYKFDSGVSTGAILTKTFRAPNLEELFSEGPHLAAYTFEVGDADLKSENGFGTEAFLKFENERGFVEATVFRNEISNFTFAKATGDTSWRTLLPIYQYTGLKALMHGFEVGFDWKVFPKIFVDGSLSFVKGDLTEIDEAIPEMPPLSGNFNARFKRNLFTFGAGIDFARKQNRLGEFEQKTDGFLIYNLFGSYTFNFGNLTNSIDFGVENLTDEEYRKHLSKVKSVMPEPGRNFKLLYKIYF